MPSSASKASISRRFSDFRHRSLGRQPLKYRFEVVPECAEGLPPGTTQVLLQWKRGLKLAETDLVDVSQPEGTATWNFKLLQVATIFKQDKALLPKEYTFKLQTVEHRHGESVRWTVGKAQVDLTQFCSLDPMCVHTLELPLSPAGTIRVKISAQWLRNFNPEDDQCTDISFMTAVSDDQDLDGFDTKENVEEATPGGTADPQGSERARVPRLSSAGELPKSKALPRASTQPAEALHTILDDVSNSYQDGVRKRASIPSLREDHPGGSSLKRGGDAAGAAPPRGALAVKTREGASGSGAASSQPQQQPRPSSRGKAPMPAVQPGTPRSTGSTPRHQKSRSDGDILFQLEGSPAACSPIDTEHYLRALASSDDEENTPAWGGKIRSWLTGQKPPRGATPLTGLTGQKGGMKPSRLPLGPAPCPITVEALRGESTVEGVRRLAVRIIDEYDAVAHRQFKLENKTAKLQAMLEASAQQKAGMAERLAQHEGAGGSDITAELVQSKLALAEAEFKVLELQGQLARERARSHKLMAKLTKLDAQYHVNRNMSGFLDSPATTPTTTGPHKLAMLRIS
mmetsp:Transcript_11791/g.30212  ORF Transcript_11791/g.30212 Transcript_11791/m.30212 type:complete len:571 (+) Transcript_11791:245-1957(+)